jgi:hypothetical protein
VEDASAIVGVFSSTRLDGGLIRPDRESRAQLAELRTHTSLAEELADGDLLRAWPTLTLQERRRLVNGLLERVVLTRADRRGRHARPVSERTAIILRGGAQLKPGSESQTAAVTR